MNNKKQPKIRFGNFWAKVQKTNICWLWTGAKKVGLRHGHLIYGKAWYQGKLQPAHRVAWKLAYGEIPTGFDILHTCNTPLCVHPFHLYLGTDIENVRDRKFRPARAIP